MSEFKIKCNVIQFFLPDGGIKEIGVYSFVYFVMPNAGVYSFMYFVMPNAKS